jgi:hypothetical protein
LFKERGYRGIVTLETNILWLIVMAIVAAAIVLLLAS